MDRTERRRDLVCALVIGVLPVAVFPALFLGLRVFDLFDIRAGFYALHALPTRLIEHGQWPLWNPYAFAGYPLLGDAQTAVFYPTSWLFLFFDGPTAFNLSVLVAFSIAGISLFALARWLGLNRLPAFVGAVAFMFCGSLTGRIVHHSIMSGTALIPLVVLCIERYLAEGGPLRLAAAAGAIALQLLPGHPQVPVLTYAALGLLTVVRSVERARTTGSSAWFVRLPGRLCAALCLGVMLAGIQVVPWFQLAQLSPRASSASFDLVFAGSNGLAEWLFFLFPYLRGSLRASYLSDVTLNVHAGMRIWEYSAYIGLLPLGLAVVGLMASPADSMFAARPAVQPRYTRAFYGILLVCAILLAAGANTPFSQLVFATPVLGKLRQPARALCLVTLSLALLAGFGAQHLQARATISPDRRRPRDLGVAVTAAALLLVPLAVVLSAGTKLELLRPQQSDLGGLGIGHPNSYMPLIFAAVSAMTLAWWALRPGSRKASWAAAAVVLLDLGAFAATYPTTAESSAYTREPETLRYLRKDTTPFRKISFWADPRVDLQTSQESVALSWSMVYGVEDADGFSSLQPRRHLDFLVSPLREDASYGHLGDPRLLRPESSILNQLNVKYVLLPAGIAPLPSPHLRPAFLNDSVRVYENMNVLPRAWWARSVRSEKDPRKVLAAVTSDGFDRRREAIVESDSIPALPQVPEDEASPIEFTTRKEDRLALRTNLGSVRFLVLSEMYFEGWSATIDGDETRIYRTNYLFRGLVVPAGQHVIELVYRPRSVVQGAAISAVALLLLLFLNGLRRYRELRTTSASASGSAAGSRSLSGAGVPTEAAARRDESAVPRRREAQRKRGEHDPS